MKASEFFSLPASLSLFANHFPAEVPPWEWVRQIGTALAGIEHPPVVTGFAPGIHIKGQVWIHPTVKLPAQATFIGPAWIGARTEVRPGAYFRGNVIVGEDCVVGNSCEFKNCLLMDGAEVPHFSYVGDSILGNEVHLAAGVICSNLRLDRQPVIVRTGDAVYETGLRKLGVIAGDAAEVGCNAVLNPGTLLGKRSLVMPAMAFGGCLPAATIAHSRPAIKFVPRRD